MDSSLSGRETGREPASPEERLVLDSVHYFRGEKRILEDITWRVCQGEHWAILGPNGSGKSTLVEIATGYIGASLGRVFLLEGWLSEIVLPEVRRRVGFVSASFADHLLRWREHTTALEVVLSGRRALLGPVRQSSEAEKAEALVLLAQSGCAHLRDTPFFILSSGERQACLIARARMAQSELLILDEPCAGLDPAARERTLAALEGACRNGRRVPQILITHHPEEIVPGISHVLLLREGKVVAQGPKEEILTESLLGETFGIRLRLVREGERVWAVPRL
ncbi:MAG: ATP-binding cassette domain-containing protein [Candidatus Omnitrophica bacterium]|nr:putative ABC transporter ATP-binding protein YlmA [bacterium]NUN95508.1 ATP-binding cassette domain-containing protein [Candidatus Omnitrophota bacterium]